MGNSDCVTASVRAANDFTRQPMARVTMKTMLMRTAVCCLLVLSAAGTVFAEPEKASHIVVLKSGKAEEKPNFPALGAKVVYEWGRRVVIDAPEAAVEGLRNNPHVKYVQRLQSVEEAVAIQNDSACRR